MLRFLFLTCLVSLASSPAFAGAELLSNAEFRSLAADLAQKVNLFHDAWEKDPTAEFYGGTTRDYLYWIKGKFKDARTRADVEKVEASLRAEPIIDLRSFIVGDSDVDIFTNSPGTLKAEEYGVRKIDYQNLEALDPRTELGKSEINQGYIPAEKIRLGRDGFHQSPGLGDGLLEIHNGPITVHFADPDLFAQTKYAKEGINHPILLALRYLRLRAIDYFQSHGPGFPDALILKQAEDPASAAAVRAVIDSTLDGKELLPYLAQPRFKSWLNGGIQKAFRSYSNPTAAKMLFEDFHVKELASLYGQHVEPINQYVFAQYHDPQKIAAAFAKDGVDPKKFFSPPATEFPDGFLYHGTKSEQGFRSILFQGVLGSTQGNAGAGLYGVRQESQKFAEDWGGKDRLLRFPVKPEARIVDLREGEGKRAWEAYAKMARSEDYDGFAARYGADILRYPYSSHAFVVKNSSVLGRGEGVYRKILPLNELVQQAASIHDPQSLFRLLNVNNLTDSEALLLVKSAPLTPGSIESMMEARPLTADLLRYGFPTLPALEQRRLGEALVREAPADDLLPFAEHGLRYPPLGNDDTFVLSVLERAQKIGGAGGKAISLAVMRSNFGNPNLPALKQSLSFYLEHDPKMFQKPSALASLLKLPKFQSYPELVPKLATQFENQAAILDALKTPGWEKHPEVLAPFLKNPANFPAIGSGLLSQPQWRFDWPGRKEMMQSAEKNSSLGAQLGSALLADDTAAAYHKVAELFLFKQDANQWEKALDALERGGPWSRYTDLWLHRYLNHPEKLRGTFFVRAQALRGKGFAISDQDFANRIAENVASRRDMRALLLTRNDLLPAGLWRPEWDDRILALIQHEVGSASSWTTAGSKAFNYDKDASAFLKASVLEGIAGQGKWTEKGLAHALRVTSPGSLAEAAAAVFKNPRWADSEVEHAALDHARILFDQISRMSAIHPDRKESALALLRANPALRQEPYFEAAATSLRARKPVAGSVEDGLDALLLLESGDTNGKLWTRVLAATEGLEAQGLPSDRLTAYYPKDAKFSDAFWREFFGGLAAEKRAPYWEKLVSRYPKLGASAGKFARSETDAALKSAAENWLKERLPAADSVHALQALEVARGKSLKHLDQELALADDLLSRGAGDPVVTDWAKRSLAYVASASLEGPEDIATLLDLQQHLARWQRQVPSLRNLAWPRLQERTLRGSCANWFTSLSPEK